MLLMIYPKCTTCKGTKKFLDGLNISYEERNIKEDNPTYEELKEWYKRSNLPLKRFFNTSGLVYKELKLKDKLPTMSEEEQLRLLATDGMLVKRPLLITEDTVVIGNKDIEKYVTKED
jgi:arsenate reductase